MNKQTKQITEDNNKVIIERTSKSFHVFRVIHFYFGMSIVSLISESSQTFYTIEKGLTVLRNCNTLTN